MILPVFNQSPSIVCAFNGHINSSLRRLVRACISGENDRDYPIGINETGGSALFASTFIVMGASSKECADMW